MKRALLLVFVALLGAAPLSGVLQAIRSSNVQQLISWAANPSPPASTPDSTSAVQLQILNLDDQSKNAILLWLNGRGRSALHALGMSDQQIGVPYYPLDYAINVPAGAVPSPDPPVRNDRRGLFGAVLPALSIPIASSTTSSSSSQTTTTPTANGYSQDTTSSSSSTTVGVGVNVWGLVGSLVNAATKNASPATPPPWRDVPFGTSILNAPDAPVRIDGGFASVRNDGTEGIACISFTNTSPKTINELDVDVQPLNNAGMLIRAVALRRAGSFAPNQRVGGPSDVQNVAHERANCVIDGEGALADTADPFSGASSVAYAVRRVLFSDGTSWIEPGANPW